MAQPQASYICIVGLVLLVIQAVAGEPPVVPGEAPAGQEPQNRTSGKNESPQASSDDASIAVRHLAQKDGAWNVAESRNFRIFHNQSKTLVDKTARVAEQARAAALKKWFAAPGAEGQPLCDLFMYASGSDYSRATGVSAQVPGHSTVYRKDDRIESRSIDVHCDVENLLTGIVPHEVTHVVVAEQFDTQRVPSWANEALGVLAESRPLIERHLRNLPRHRQEGQLFRCADLLALKSYPTQRQMGPFYAQSVSLVEFFSEVKDAKTFPIFLREGLRSDWATALRKHYGLSFDELEQRWRARVFPDLTIRAGTLPVK